MALLGGGEFSFEETVTADEAWLARTGPGPIGFLPAASGSSEYGDHLAAYLDARFSRRLEKIPVYRPRDARRQRNAERIEACSGVYLGGGIAEQLVEALAGSPCLEALEHKLRRGGTIVAIAAAAQALGETVRGIRGGFAAGLGWLPGGVLEGNFDPRHDRRLREAVGRREVVWGLGIPAGCAVLLGPGGELEVSGLAFGLTDAEEDLEVMDGTGG